MDRPHKRTPLNECTRIEVRKNWAQRAPYRRFPRGQRGQLPVTRKTSFGLTILTLMCFPSRKTPESLKSRVPPVSLDLIYFDPTNVTEIPLELLGCIPITDCTGLRPNSRQVRATVKAIAFR